MYTRAIVCGICAALLGSCVTTSERPIATPPQGNILNAKPFENEPVRDVVIASVPAIEVPDAASVKQQAAHSEESPAPPETFAPFDREEKPSAVVPETQNASTATTECSVIENRDSGVCIFHTPCSPYRNQTIMDPAKGDACVNTVNEAESHGCRAPQHGGIYCAKFPPPVVEDGAGGKGTTEPKAIETIDVGTGTGPPSTLKKILRAAGSELALKIYSLIGFVAILGASIYAAVKQMRWLQKLQPGTYQKAFRGPKPIRQATIEKQLKQAKEFRNDAIKKASLRATCLITTGFIIPSVLFVVGALHYGWFVKNGYIFVDAAKNPIPNPSWLDAISFISNQFFRATLLDILEVFDVQWSPVTFNPSSWIVKGLLLLYRSYVAIFGAVLVTFFIGAVRARFSSSEREEDLEELLRKVKEEPNGDSGAQLPHQHAANDQSTTVFPLAA